LRLALTTFVLAATTSAALAGQVFVVGNGPGQITSLQDAITLAADGDVILVKNSGPHLSVRIANKSVAIMTDGFIGNQVSGAVRVTGTPSQSTVVLSGLFVYGTQSTAIPELGTGLFAKNCAGSIVAQDCEFHGAGAFTGTCVDLTASPAVSLDACPSASFARCFLKGGYNDSQYGKDAGHGITAKAGSRVSLDSTISRGGSGGTTCSNPMNLGTNGGTGITLMGSSAYLCGSTAEGGAGAPPAGTHVFDTAGDGGNGVSALGGAVNLTRLSATILAGQYGWNPGCGLCGSCCDGNPGVALFGPMTQVTLPGNAKRLTGPSVVRDTAIPEFRVFALPGERVELAVARATTFATDPVSGCVLHVRDPSWVVIGTVPTGGNQVSRRYHMPDLPITNPAQLFYVQARVTSPTGVVRLSNVQAVALVDASY